MSFVDTEINFTFFSCSFRKNIGNDSVRTLNAVIFAICLKRGALFFSTLEVVTGEYITSWVPVRISSTFYAQLLPTAFTHSFYAHGSQKRKKAVKSLVSFCTFGICTPKSCALNVDFRSENKHKIYFGFTLEMVFLPLFLGQTNMN